MTVDLSKLTANELKAELQRREQAQNENREAYKALVNEAIPQIIGKLQNYSEQMAEVKLHTFEALKILLDTKNEVYEVKGDQQSHTFTDTHGNTITYGFRVIDNWDDTVNAGIEKVNHFIASLAKDDDSAKLVSVINRLLKKDAKGNLKASRVLELTRVAKEFNSPAFTDAVTIIAEAYRPQRSAFYIEANTLDEQGKKCNIPLSLSSVDFPPGTDIKHLFPVHQKYEEQTTV